MTQRYSKNDGEVELSPKRHTTLLLNNQNYKLTPILPNASFVPIFSVSCGTCRDYSASISSSKSSSSKINALAFVQSEP